MENNLEDNVQQALGTKRVYIVKVMYSYQDGTEHPGNGDSVLHKKEILAVSPEEAVDICCKFYKVISSTDPNLLYWLRVNDKETGEHLGDWNMT